MRSQNAHLENSAQRRACDACRGEATQSHGEATTTPPQQTSDDRATSISGMRSAKTLYEQEARNARPTEAASSHDHERLLGPPEDYMQWEQTSTRKNVTHDRKQRMYEAPFNHVFERRRSQTEL